MISGHGSRCVAPAFALLPDPVDEALARSDSTFRSPRMFDAAATDPVEGRVRWKPAKSLWITGMTLAAVLGGPVYFT